MAKRPSTHSCLGKIASVPRRELLKGRDKESKWASLRHLSSSSFFRRREARSIDRSIDSSIDRSKQRGSPFSNFIFSHPVLLRRRIQRRIDGRRRRRRHRGRFINQAPRRDIMTPFPHSRSNVVARRLDLDSYFFTLHHTVTSS